MRFTALSCVLVSIVGSACAQQTAWGQCGGMNWNGATTCIAGYVCTYSNPWYSQCLPGTASTTTSKSMAVSTTTSKSTTTPMTTTSIASTLISTTKSTSSAATTTTGGGGTPGSGPGTTLQAGYYWIRAVEAPNFHKYLQTAPEYTTGIALMGDYTTAGQFNIVNGQLVELVTGGLLYGVVSPQSNSTETKLAVTFSKSQNTYGTFAFSGDAVTWTIPSISRPNSAAWLVCAGQQLFINLGPYAYNTPAGCADETIHYYNGATAVS